MNQKTHFHLQSLPCATHCHLSVTLASRVQVARKQAGNQEATAFRTDPCHVKQTDHFLLRAGEATDSLTEEILKLCSVLRQHWPCFHWLQPRWQTTQVNRHFTHCIIFTALLKIITKIRLYIHQHKKQDNRVRTHAMFRKVKVCISMYEMVQGPWQQIIC